jgi:HSP20 family protein
MLRFEPFFGDLDREIDRFIQQTQRQKRSAVQFGHHLWRPLVDVFETEDMVVAVVELAGVDQEAVDLTVEDTTLAIRGRRSPASEYQARSFHQMEISYGSFERVVPLPSPVDPEAATATMRSGMLQVCMPKARRQHISIRVRPTEP